MSFSHFWLSNFLPLLSGGKWVSSWVGAELPPAGLDPSQQLTNIQLILVCHCPCFSQQSWQEPYVFICRRAEHCPLTWKSMECSLQACAWLLVDYWSAISSTPHVLMSQSPTHRVSLRACQGCSLQVSHAWKDGRGRSEAAQCVVEPRGVVTRTFSQAGKVESGRCPQVYTVNINNNIGYLEKSLHLKWFTS